MVDETARTGLTDEQVYQALKAELGVGDIEMPYLRRLNARDYWYLRTGDSVVYAATELAEQIFPGLGGALQGILNRDSKYEIERLSPVYKPGEATIIGAYVSLHGVTLTSLDARLPRFAPSIRNGIPIETLAADADLEIALRSRGRFALEESLRIR